MPRAKPTAAYGGGNVRRRPLREIVEFLKWVAPYVTAAALLSPVVVSAQEVVVSAPPPVVVPPPPPPVVSISPPPAVRLVPRLRLETGLEGGFASVGVGTNSGSAGFGPGLYFRIGVQIAERFGVQAESSIVIIPSIYPIGYLRGALTFNFTPVKWFTLSSGPVINLLFDASGYAGGAREQKERLFLLRIKVALDSPPQTVRKMRDS